MDNIILVLIVIMGLHFLSNTVYLNRLLNGEDFTPVLYVILIIIAAAGFLFLSFNFGEFLLSLFKQ